MSKHFLTNSAGTPLMNSAGQYLYEQITLPTGYQEVEYIATSGTQYINTGYILKSHKFKVDLIVQFTGSDASTFASYLGFMKSSSAPTPRFGIHNYGSGVFMYGVNATINTPNAVTNNKTFLVFNSDGTIDDSTQALSVDGEITSVTSGYNMSSNTLSLYLGARNVAGAANNAISAKFYRFKLAVNGRKVLDLIPCYQLSDNAIGMYDIVNGVFYKNSGTGSFTKGHDL